MRGFEALGKKLEESGKKPELLALADTPEGKKLSGLVDQDEVERAVKNGDAAALQGILRRVLETDDGKKLAQRLSQAMK